jgi:tetratricopeptide (TPR) repeat protein
MLVGYKDNVMTFDDNMNTDDIDFNKQKRGKGKNKRSSKNWSFFIIEGIIVLVAVVAGGRFLFSENTEISHLQATIDAQQSQLLPPTEHPLKLATALARDSQNNGQPSLTAADLFERAQDEIANGLSSDALRSLDLALELNPEYADAYFERGELRYDSKQYYFASEDYEHALQYNYSSPTLATYKLGRARFEGDNYSDAIDAFNTVIEFDDDYEAAYYWRGRAYTKLYEYQTGIDDMLYSIEKGYDQIPYVYFWVGKAYDDSENYESAVQYYSLSIKHSADDCEEYLCWIDYNNRGTAYHWLEDYDSAIQDYTRAIELKPEPYPLAFKNRGDAHEEQGNLTLALSDWNTMFLLLEDDPITRTISADSSVLRDALDNDDSQIHVEFEGTAGDTVTLLLTTPDDSNLNTMLILRDTNNSPIAYAAPSDTYDAQLEDIVLPETGVYTLVIASNLANSSGEFTLRLEQK